MNYARHVLALNLVLAAPVLAQAAESEPCFRKTLADGSSIEAYCEVISSQEIKEKGEDSSVRSDRISIRLRRKNGEQLNIGSVINHGVGTIAPEAIKVLDARICEMGYVFLIHWTESNYIGLYAYSLKEPCVRLAYSCFPEDRSLCSKRRPLWQVNLIPASQSAFVLVQFLDKTAELWHWNPFPPSHQPGAFSFTTCSRIWQGSASSMGEGIRQGLGGKGTAGSPQVQP